MVPREMEVEMAKSVIHSSCPCKEQGTSGSINFRTESFKLTHQKGTSSGSHNVNFRTESFKLTHQKGNSSGSDNVNFRTEGFKLTHQKGTSSGSDKLDASTSTSISTSGNTLPAHHCAICNTLTTCFSSYRLRGELLCRKCGALQRWRITVTATKTTRRRRSFVAATKTTLMVCMEDEKKSVGHPVNDKELHRPSLLEDPIIDVFPDGSPRISTELLTESGVAATIHTEQASDSEDTIRLSIHQPAGSKFKCCHITRKAGIGAFCSWVVWKWLIRVLNVLAEVCQATLAQENAQMKLNNLVYRRLTVMTSSTCLLISLVEIAGEARDSNAECRRKGYCCCPYYPGTLGRPFWKFSLYFGAISSAVQFCFNLKSLSIGKSFVAFDSLPLLLSFSHLVVAIADPRVAVGKCPIHNKVLACQQCEEKNGC